MFEKITQTSLTRVLQYSALLAHIVLISYLLLLSIRVMMMHTEQVKDMEDRISVRFHRIQVKMENLERRIAE